MFTVKSGIRIALLAAALFSVEALHSQEHPEVWDLATCIDYARKHNISIQKSRINAESSAIDVLTARANLFPNLSFSSGHNYVNRPLSGDGSQKKNSYNGNYGLNSSWTVFNGGRNTKTVSLTKLNKQIADLQVEQSENDIEVAITQIYLQILYADEAVKINESTLQVSESQVNRAQELLNAGLIARSDLAQLEAQYSNDNYQLVNALVTLQSYKLQLKQLLELDGEEEMTLYLPEINDDSVLTPLPSVADVYRMALTFRPEIEAGKLNMEASDLEIAIARAAYLPTLNLSAGTGTNHTTGNDFTFGEQVKNGWNNSLGLSISVPIFNNRQTKSAVQKAKLQYENSKLDMLNEEKALYSTIEGYWLDATTAQQRYIAAREKLNSAQVSYELVNEQFNLGMKNTVELLTEQNNLQSAKQELVQAKYMAILNMHLLYFYSASANNDILLRPYAAAARQCTQVYRAANPLLRGRAVKFSVYRAANPLLRGGRGCVTSRRRA